MGDTIEASFKNVQPATKVMRGDDIDSNSDVGDDDNGNYDGGIDGDDDNGDNGDGDD